MKMDDGPERRPRNDRFVDVWSLTHLAWGVLLTVLFGPWVALVALFVWEPLEVLVLSPLLWKVRVQFGREGLMNSLSDLAFDAIGVALGILLARGLGWDVPVVPL